MPDKRFQEAYDTIELDPGSAARVWAALEQELPPRKEKAAVKKYKNPVRIAVIAAILAVLMIGTAYAVSGMAAYTATHAMPNTGEYTSFSALPKAEKTAGYPITAVERFSDGYAFERMLVNGEAVYDEAAQPLQTYYSVTLYYAKPGAPELLLSTSPVPDVHGGQEAPEPNETRSIGGVDVRLSHDRYRLVPEDYEKTEADLAAEAAGHFYISFGADEIEERDLSSADFTLGEVNYVLLCFADVPFDELSALAAELIAAAGS